MFNVLTNTWSAESVDKIPMSNDAMSVLSFRTAILLSAPSPNSAASVIFF